MKKITYLLLTLFFSIVGYSQFTPLVEGFEATTGPEPLPANSWFLNTGEWLVFDNLTSGAGTTRWGITTEAEQVYQGSNSAYCNRPTSFDDGQTVREYLVTPEVTVPENGELKFYTRGFFSGVQGTVYKVLIAPANADPLNEFSYSLLKQWSDADLTSNILQYEEKIVVELSAYANMNVRIAFVLEQAPIEAPFGDRWFIDDVTVVEKCNAPTGATVNNITHNSAQVTWTSPGSTSWEIQVIPADQNPGTVWMPYTGTLPLTVTTTLPGNVPLLPNTNYKVLIRVACTNTTSQFIERTFTTLRTGLNCNSATVITSLPYTTNDSTSNYADTYDTAQPQACLGVTTNFMAGNDVFYSYYATADGEINIKMTPSANNSSIFVYKGCPAANNPCVGGVGNNNSTPRNLTIPVEADTLYIIVLSSSSGTQTYSYNLVIQESFCVSPTGLAVSNIGQNTANFSWNAGDATSWEFVVQQVGLPLPTSGVVTTNNTNFPSPVALISNTNYEFYVRAACSDGVNFSPWVGPIPFLTLCEPFAIPFQEGFNTGSTSQNCWTVVNANNDADAWNMDYATNPFEGDQSASILTNNNGTSATSNNDWLISPQIILNGNQRLKYRYRVEAANDPNAFRVMLSTTGTDIAGFTETLVAQATYNNVTYLERVVDLSAYSGVVNIAWHVPGGGPDGNRLYIDNVIVEDIPTCVEPTLVTSSNVTYNTATIAWTNGSTETEWHVLAVPCGSPAPNINSVGWVVANQNPFTLPNLNSFTCYNVYVRSVCGVELSAWSSDPTIFTTEVAPPICGGNFVDAGGPNGNYAANSNVTISACAEPGQLITVTFTSFNIQANNDALYVFDGNSVNAPQIASNNPAANVPGGLAGGFWGTTIPGPFTSSEPGGCLTFNFRSDATTQTAGWFANVTCTPAPGCTAPSNITTSELTSESVDLTWVQHANPSGSVSNEWHVIAIRCGQPAPNSSTTGYTVANINNSFELGGLEPNTCYDIYIRAACSSTEFSSWTSIKNIRTVCVAFPIPFQEGFNSDSESENCWTVLNLNNDADEWNLNFATNPYEGDQVAMMLTDGNGTGANNNNDWLISPQITGLNGNQRLKYRYRIQSSSEPNSFRVMLSQGSINPTDFTTTLVPLRTYNNTTYIEEIVNLTNITGTINIGFHVPPSGPDGFRIYIDKVVVENIPTCFEPVNLRALNTTATSAYLAWDDVNNPQATQWEVIVLPFGSSEPLPNLPIGTGYVVSSNPALITGLAPSKQYHFYVRAICDENDHSAWSVVPGVFTTKPANDLCVDAEFVPVNSSQVCNQIVSGVLSGAGPSTGIPFTCVGTPDDDVWYKFIATNQYLSVSIRNVVGTTTNLNFAVYRGECDALIQVACSDANSLSDVLNNLTLNETYYIRVYSNSPQPQTVSFDICITTPSTCSNAPTVCNIEYGNTVGVSSLGTIGCLSSSPNPTFFIIQVTESGPINYLLTQSSVQGGTPDRDVDYAAWGPFTSQSQACSTINLPNGGFAPPGIGVPVTQSTGCSFSAASTETFNIVNAQAGQFYVILITNFSNQSGFISLTQTNQGQPNAGATTCCPDAEFRYDNTQYCKAPGVANPFVTVSPNSLSGTFSAYPNGIQFVNNQTGEIDLMNSAPGYYQITNTLEENENCIEKKYYFFVRITEPQNATISYTIGDICQNSTDTIPVTITGATNGNFSVTPQGGLFIDPSTGTITPNLSSPGTYNIRYDLPGNNVCPTSPGNTSFTIKAIPNIETPINQEVCDSFELPSISVGNYFTGSLGTGEQLTLPYTVTESQTLYIYANSSGCEAQKELDIVINRVDAPTVDVVNPTCAVPTGSIEVTSPVGPSQATFPNLFISEVTDAVTGSLTYVELFNATGSPVDLSNYKLKFYTYGTAGTPPPNLACDLPLSGTIANYDTVVIKVSNSANQGGVVPDLTFTSCSGVNNNDHIKLTTITDVEVDLWGKTDGSVFTPANQVGYTYRRLSSAPIPSNVWNAADWTTLDPEDYTDIGNYDMPIVGYEYSLDGGEFQSGTLFTGVPSGVHTVVVKDLVTGCLSAPFEVILSPGSDSTLPTFEQVAPICPGGSLQPLPTTSQNGVTGTWSPALNNNETTIYTFTPGEGQCAQIVQMTIVVNNASTPTFADIPAICSGGQNPLPLTSLEGITGTWSPAFNNLASGTYTFTPDNNQCAGSTSVTVQVNDLIIPVFDPIDTEVCFGASIIPLELTSTNGIFGTWSPALNNTATTTYTFTPNSGQCSSTTSVTINVVDLPSISITQGCKDAAYTLSSVTTSSSATYEWFNSSNVQIGTDQNVVVTSSGTYKLIVTNGDCSNEQIVNVESASCLEDVQKGISANGDGYNDNFELTGFDVTQLQIFNRYGVKVYAKKNYTNEWYGQSDKGEELPDGTYYYVIERVNNKTLTGWIYINREQ
jgi:gliding motility-associated-like protein